MMLGVRERPMGSCEFYDREGLMETSGPSNAPVGHPGGPTQANHSLKHRPQASQEKNSLSIAYCPMAGVLLHSPNKPRRH